MHKLVRMKKIFNKKGMEMQELVLWGVAFAFIIVLIILIILFSKGLNIKNVFPFL